MDFHNLGLYSPQFWSNTTVTHIVIIGNTIQLSTQVLIFSNFSKTFPKVKIFEIWHYKFWQKKKGKHTCARFAWTCMTESACKFTKFTSPNYLDNQKCQSLQNFININLSLIFPFIKNIIICSSFAVTFSPQGVYIFGKISILLKWL